MFSFELTLNGLTVPAINITGRPWQEIEKRLPVALLAGASYVAGQIRLNLSGPSHTNYDIPNPYPGTITNRLKQSFTAGNAYHRHTVEPYRVWWGSLVKYAGIHEHGGYIFITDRMRGKLHSIGIHPKAVTLFVHIPPRPYVAPAVKRSTKKVAQLIRARLMKKVTQDG